MSTALDVLGDLPPVSAHGDDQQLRDDFTKAATFLPRIEFKSDASNIVKKKQFPGNHFSFTVKKGEMKDLGESFVCVPVAYRYKAVDFRDPKKVKSHFDPNSSEFRDCHAETKVKRPQGEKSPCMVGPEFLVYLDQHGWATLHCTNGGLKEVANKLFGMLRTFVQFGHHLEERGSFVYEAPNVGTFAGSYDLPDKDRLVRAITEFTKVSPPVESEHEPEDEDTGPAAPGSNSDRAR